jgi:gliding motility-associated-like protein
VDKGQLRIHWTPPSAQEQQGNPGAVNYQLNHHEGMQPTGYNEISTKTGFYDTTHTQTGINSQDSGQAYKLELIYEGSAYGIASRASSVYLHARRLGAGVELWAEHYVPWENKQYIFMRKESAGPWDTLARTGSPSYTDTLLTNYTTYCYKVKTEGRYDSVPEVPYLLENWSQETCVEIVDTTAPVPLEINAVAYCGNNYNLVSWRRVQDDEYEDVAGYILYYAPQRGQNPDELARVDDINDTTHEHQIGDNQAGCYYYRVYDLYGNQGPLSNAACVEGCFNYDLPNIFTPNGDGFNDVFRPVQMENIEKAHIIIFNRWGNTIYETTDPAINWDGTIQRSGRKVSEGTYYYVADIWEKTLDGTKQRSIPGFITVIYGKDNTPPNSGTE